MKIAFRADASFDIGSGHVMRCLTLAQSLREKGAECRFICRDFPGNLEPLITRQGFQTYLLEPTAPNSATTSEHDKASPYASWLGGEWELDAAQTIGMIGNNKPDWIVVDHYGIDHKWETRVRNHCEKIMVIDDLANRKHNCDLLLDQNLTDHIQDRYSSLLPEGCAHLLGPKYALLQHEYAHAHPRTPPRLGPVTRILTYFGGSDQKNLTLCLIDAFIRLKRNDLFLDVIANPQSPHIASIRKTIGNRQNIVLHEHLPSLCDLMIKADLAFGASGATSWERCCLGLPSYVVTLADNQIPIAKALSREGFVEWIGDHSEVTADSFLAALSRAIDLQDTLTDWSSHCRTLVDGNGTHRVVSAMMLNNKTPLAVRRAELRDEQILFEWATERFIQKNDINSDPIDALTHRKWFYKYLREPNSALIFIVETETRLPVGQVQFEATGNGWDIHYGTTSIIRGSSAERQVIEKSIAHFRMSRTGAIVFKNIITLDKNPTQLFQRKQDSDSLGVRKKKPLAIAVCSQTESWINNWIPNLLLTWIADGHSCTWVHNSDDLPEGDVCFYLSYERIVNKRIRARFRNNLVVHASDLPKGRGWSPTTWMILNDARQIPVTLIEAEDGVDTGHIYAQTWFNILQTDLIDDWREKLAAQTVNLANQFIANYPDSLKLAKPQIGEPTYYPRRRPNDSEINPDKTLREQFNILRVIDNNAYPAFFHLGERTFLLKIYSRDQRNS